MRFGTRALPSLLFIGLLLCAAPAQASVESELAFHRGVAAYGAGQLDESRSQFERVLAADPNDTAAIHYLGLIAQAEGDPEEAIELYRRALALTPDDTDLRFDLGTALLDAGRTQEAREAFAEVLTREPDRARAVFFTGVVEYREGNYAEALAHFEKAEQLDPELVRETRYYSGLALSYLGNYSEAAGAFGFVEGQSPLDPLGRSASALRKQVTPPPPDRRWSLAATAGVQWDSNPTVVGEFANENGDVASVFLLRGSYRLFDSERIALDAGYDGYVSLYGDEHDFNLQSHLGWTSVTARADPVRFNLRYDFSYTWVDLNDSFRALNRLTPSMAINMGDWGISQIFYQFQHAEFFRPDLTLTQAALDADGRQNSVGAAHFYFLDGPIHYVRIGGLWDTYDSDGPEFDYDGWELGTGIEFELPWQILGTGEYRYGRRDYDNQSFFEPNTRRNDRVNYVSLEFSRPLIGNMDVSVVGSYRDQHSNVGVYDYDRAIGGVFFTYGF
jgi:tetratricopeptide (TPR) repeat protein